LQGELYFCLMVHIVTARVRRGHYILPNALLCFREVTGYNVGSGTIAVLTEVFRIFSSLSTQMLPACILCCSLFTACPRHDTTLPELQNKPGNMVMFLPAPFVILLWSHVGYVVGRCMCPSESVMSENTESMSDLTPWRFALKYGGTVWVSLPWGEFKWNIKLNFINLLACHKMARDKIPIS
jgi:hypothetical protein